MSGLEDPGSSAVDKRKSPALFYWGKGLLMLYCVVRHIICERNMEYSVFIPPTNEFEAMSVLEDPGSSAAEKTYAVKVLVGKGYRNKEFRDILHVSSWYTISHMITVSNRLAESLYELWHKNCDRLTIAHVRTIARWKKSEQQVIMRDTLAKNWSQRRLEREYSGNKPPVSADMRTLGERVSETLGFDTTITYAENSGTILIKYYSAEDCDNILEKLGYRNEE